MDSLIVAYYPLVLTIVGTLLNLLTLIILCRSTFRNTRARPTIYYLRAIAIFDILMLYGWNFDHYLSDVYGFTIQRLSIFSCRLLSFLNYFAAQSSAWLRIFVCLDRYLVLSRVHQTWFSHSKNVLITIAGIILCLTLLNLHFIIFSCSYKVDGTISVQSGLFQIYPLWDYVNLGVYNCVPFILMVIFNSGVIYHLIRLRRITIIQNSRMQHRSISITLVMTTFLFLIMTVPATIAFAFFSTGDVSVLHVLDALLYSYHITSCPLYFATCGEFRRACIAILLCRKNKRRVLPLPQIPLN